MSKATQKIHIVLSNLSLVSLCIHMNIHMRERTRKNEFWCTALDCFPSFFRIGSNRIERGGRRGSHSIEQDRRGAKYHIAEHVLLVSMGGAHRYHICEKLGRGRPPHRNHTKKTCFEPLFLCLESTRRNHYLFDSNNQNQTANLVRVGGSAPHININIYIYIYVNIKMHICIHQAVCSTKYVCLPCLQGFVQRGTLAHCSYWSLNAKAVQTFSSVHFTKQHL